MIKSMDYCKVVSDKKLKGSGLSRGDVVMVVGTEYVPCSRKDPYLQRMLVNAIKLEGEQHLLPSQSNDYLVYKLDPRSLEKVSDYDTKRLQAELRRAYGH